MKSNKLNLIVALIAAIIMLQTLFYKFSGSAESIYIFSTLGIEPWGRIGAGISELIASILLLIPRTRLLGALMGLGIMLGAIAAHILVLGIAVQGDGGKLFILALLTFIACVVLLINNRKQIPQILKYKF
ncbi:MAG: DoxX family protein [bacterium]|nr:DoxX family protein [bacterium]